jgi:inorganic pyrophosphatase
MIEIPDLSGVKTELDNTTDLLRVDCIFRSSLIYSANYGFIPSTLAKHDPLDILILHQLSISPLAIVQVRPIWFMPMVDSGRPDNKIVAVALNDPEYTVYSDINQLPPFKILLINQLFNDSRVLERKQVNTSKPAERHHSEGRRVLRPRVPPPTRT